MRTRIQLLSSLHRVHDDSKTKRKAEIAKCYIPLPHCCSRSAKFYLTVLSSQFLVLYIIVYYEGVDF